jgi:putative transposase
MDTGMGLDTLEQARQDRPHSTRLVLHSYHWSQYMSLTHITRQAEVGAAPSIGRVEAAYDNTPAESVIGLYNTTVIVR